jgi:hypothetical protein
MMLFTKPERNEIYDAIARSDLDPVECDLEVSQSSAVLTHKSGSCLEFRVNTNGTKFRVHSVIADVSDKRDEIGLEISWVAPYVTDWANSVKEGIELIDLWADIRRGQEILSDIEGVDSGNTSFTQDEQKQIAAQLQEVKKELKEQFELSSEQMTRIDERLDQAVEASTRMGRKDWLLLFGGTVFNLIVTDTVTSGVAGHIFTMVIQGLIHLFGTGGPPQVLT